MLSWSKLSGGTFTLFISILYVTIKSLPALLFRLQIVQIDVYAQAYACIIPIHITRPRYILYTGLVICRPYLLSAGFGVNGDTGPLGASGAAGRPGILGMMGRTGATGSAGLKGRNGDPAGIGIAVYFDFIDV